MIHSTLIFSHAKSIDATELRNSVLQESYRLGESVSTSITDFVTQFVGDPIGSIEVLVTTLGIPKDAMVNALQLRYFEETTVDFLQRHIDKAWLAVNANKPPETALEVLTVTVTDFVEVGGNNAEAETEGRRRRRRQRRGLQREDNTVSTKNGGAPHLRGSSSSRSSRQRSLQTSSSDLGTGQWVATVGGVGSSEFETAVLAAFDQFREIYALELARQQLRPGKINEQDYGAFFGGIVTAIVGTVPDNFGAKPGQILTDRPSEKKWNAWVYICIGGVVLSFLWLCARIAWDYAEYAATGHFEKGDFGGGGPDNRREVEEDEDIDGSGHMCGDTTMPLSRGSNHSRRSNHSRSGSNHSRMSAGSNHSRSGMGGGSYHSRSSSGHGRPLAPPPSRSFNSGQLPLPRGSGHGRPIPNGSGHGRPIPNGSGHGRPMPNGSSHGRPMPNGSSHGRPMPNGSSHGRPMPPQRSTSFDAGPRQPQRANSFDPVRRPPSRTGSFDPVRRPPQRTDSFDRKPPTRTPSGSSGPPQNRAGQNGRGIGPSKSMPPAPRRRPTQIKPDLSDDTSSSDEASDIESDDSKSIDSLEDPLPSSKKKGGPAAPSTMKGMNIKGGRLAPKRGKSMPVGAKKKPSNNQEASSLASTLASTTPSRNKAGQDRGILRNQSMPVPKRITPAKKPANPIVTSVTVGDDSSVESSLSGDDVKRPGNKKAVANKSGLNTKKATGKAVPPHTNGLSLSNHSRGSVEPIKPGSRIRPPTAKLNSLSNSNHSRGSRGSVEAKKPWERTWPPAPKVKSISKGLVGQKNTAGNKRGVAPAKSMPLPGRKPQSSRTVPLQPHKPESLMSVESSDESGDEDDVGPLPKTARAAPANRGVKASKSMPLASTNFPVVETVSSDDEDEAPKPISLRSRVSDPIVMFPESDVNDTSDANKRDAIPSTTSKRVVLPKRGVRASNSMPLKKTGDADNNDEVSLSLSEAMRKPPNKKTVKVVPSKKVDLASTSKSSDGKVAPPQRGIRPSRSMPATTRDTQAVTNENKRMISLAEMTHDDSDESDSETKERVTNIKVTTPAKKSVFHKPAAPMSSPESKAGASVMSSSSHSKASKSAKSPSSNSTARKSLKSISTHSKTSVGSKTLGETNGKKVNKANSDIPNNKSEPPKNKSGTAGRGVAASKSMPAGS
jgi:hypothetical protein